MPERIDTTPQPARELVLAAGLRWLFDTEQPDTAILQHHGLRLAADGNRTFRFIPYGWNKHAIVVVDVTRVEQVSRGAWTEPANPLDPDELIRLSAELAGLDAEVIHTWNGHPGTSGSLALEEPAHPSLVAAVYRYLSGCPDHAMKHAMRGVFCDCGWYQRGRTQVVLPQIQAVTS
jgi:hypothetical protein